jgi:hypothetical protein
MLTHGEPTITGVPDVAVSPQAIAELSFGGICKPDDWEDICQTDNRGNRKNPTRTDPPGRIKRIKEWLSLSLRGVSVNDPGDSSKQVVFGPNTQAALEIFQVMLNRRTGTSRPIRREVDQELFDLLTAPMRKALQGVPAVLSPSGRTDDYVVAYARQHLAQDPSPQEVHLSVHDPPSSSSWELCKKEDEEVLVEFSVDYSLNRGPWVRLYSDGLEDSVGLEPSCADPHPSHAWCAWFATFVLAQACFHLKRELPLKLKIPQKGDRRDPEWGKCWKLGSLARQDGRLLERVRRTKNGSYNQSDIEQITPGSLVLVHTKDGWHHAGIVEGATSRGVDTIEGNTNREGGREGGFVMRQTPAVRPYDKKNGDYLSFVLTGDLISCLNSST